VQDFIMNAADPNVLFSGNGNTCDSSTTLSPIYKSTDGGATWQPLTGTEGFRPLLTANFEPNLVFAANCEQPFLSTDSGHTWTPKPGAGEGFWNVYQIDKMAALTGRGQDGGLLWSVIYAGGEAPNGSGIVAISFDLGDSWLRLTPNIYPSSWGLSAMTI